MNAQPHAPAPRTGAVPRAAVVVLVGLAIVLMAAVALWPRGEVDAAKAVSDQPVAVADVPTTRPEKLGAPRDPLSLAEWGYAKHLAETKGSIPAGATDAEGDAGVEFLSANLPTTDVDARHRLVTVSLYDYTTNAQHDVTVDLTDGAVVTTKSATGVQSPTTLTESAEAIELFLASPKSAKLKDQFKQRTGSDLTSPTQVTYTGGSFTATSSVVGAEKCGDHRCVQMQIQGPDGVYLATADFVVDLTARSVITIK